ncbi:DUF2971 domain-containing protein [Ensifer sp. ENS11]|uniref:DUF2971 domain-containing protein n=1 Tax=Ensifer sp. ENS11 TaxID=2769291 RepID=UPI0017835139|nr:DUF2971 domain-containing protein [Ensifer sp. ENS11]MBD9488748.1 DUF2971 domain-containing protein [Ensifer sp. ENS11]
MTERHFRRYTNLAATLHILRNRCLTLLSPETWDDQNDAFFMSEYKRLKDLKSLLALCLAVREETYHHWRVFSHGADGVCIEFDAEKLRAAFDAAGVQHQYVEYEYLRNVSRMSDVVVDRLPFMKRWPYGDESEYRAVYSAKELEKETYDVPVALDAIVRITLSPWLAPCLVHAVRESLRSIQGCSRLKVSRSTLIDNPQWKKLTGRVAVPVAP